MFIARSVLSHGTIIRIAKDRITGCLILRSFIAIGISAGQMDITTALNLFFRDTGALKQQKAYFFITSLHPRYEGLPIGEGFNFNAAAFQRAENVAIGHREIYFYRRDNAGSVTIKFPTKSFV